MTISSLPLRPFVKSGDFIFVSGQLGFTEPGVLIDGGIEEQTAQALRNIETILAAEGSSLDKIVKTNIWLTGKEYFPGFNKAYGAAFTSGIFPARSTVVSGLLIEGAVVEIDAIARIGD